ncbi:DinB family protein [Mucilaginibacter sp. cycad4]|uniref:DinB family protein n=1 Tax=Mucilaginibacter sp. cycad4 TaxID=3342096 RepID=UPI002AAA8D5D|nr:DinB family protein [Mucilaginibacter gossypii]WPV02207.1 DinB family protein [Mucilaginibacter gossypii]
MKTYFLKMFNYNLYANQQLVQAIETGGSPAMALKLMGHLLAAEQAWLERCKLIPSSMPNSWPDNVTIEQCKKQVLEHYQTWVTFLNGIDEKDLDKIIPYHSFTGDYFENQLGDIITQVLNHGTHTRAQIGQQLKFAGTKTLPVTDYSYYLRVLNS